MNWSALDFTGLANAALALLTASIMVIAVKIGRRAKPIEPPPAETKMQGVAIISAEPLKQLVVAIEAAKVDQEQTRKDVRVAFEITLKLFERLVLAQEAQAEHQEAVAKAQKVLADQQQADMAEHLEALERRITELLGRLGEAPIPSR